MHSRVDVADRAAPLLTGDDAAQARHGGEASPAASSNHISRHRRIHKQVGAITGVTFVDHPKGHGVIVSDLHADGSCKSSGVRVGDHVTKINGEKPADQKHAVALCDAAWTAEADGTDKNKDRLKFSLHHRTQDFELRALRQGSLSAGVVVDVEVLGSSGQRRGLVGGSKKTEETGLGLQDSPRDHYGAVVSSVVEKSAAHVAGLAAGLTVVAVDEKLCMGGAREANKMIAAGIAKKGSASLVCHLPKQEGEHV